MQPDKWPERCTVKPESLEPIFDPLERAMESRLYGQYRTQEILGVGSVGTVYRARHVETDIEVALKVLASDVCHDQLIKARFEREMSILAKLDHPAMINYLQGGKQGDQLYYAMELLDAGTVKELLQSTGRFSWQETAECGRQIASVLQYAHNHNIIHRDLKSSNLFITDEGRLKLGDFGIARDTTAKDLTLKGITVGTYAYMAPEQIRGERTVSGKSDLYSMGCVLFEMLTGSVPFQGQNFHEIVEQHLHRQPPDLSHLPIECPQELAELVRRLLEKDPEKRPFNARYVQGFLDDLLRRKAAEFASQTTSIPGASQKDVGADRARPDLRGRLQRRPRIEPREISWLRLAMLFLIAIGAATAAWFFAHRG